MINDPENYSYETIKEAVNQLDHETKNIAVLLYATGARVSEVIQIKKCDIITDENYMHINCKVLKKRKGIGKRIAIVRLDETWLTEPINQMLQNKQDQDILLPYTRFQIWRKLRNIIILGEQFNPHAFRKLRATHLATKYKYTGQQLTRFFNWSRSDMADNYVKLNVEDLRY